MQNTHETCTVDEALLWIVSILTVQQIPYQIVGGTAVHLYGGTRSIVDIDMYIPKTRGAELASILKDLISKPLQHYVEDVWDIEYFQIKYKGQKIEFGLSPGAKIYDKKSEKWIEQIIDFERSSSKLFHGLELPLMPIVELLKYKTILDREVDRIDVLDMQRVISG